MSRAIRKHAARRTPIDRPSEISLLATRIRLAMQYLQEVHGWSLHQIETLTGDDETALHKNSLMKIKDFEKRYAIPSIGSDGRRHWVEAPDQNRPPPEARIQWIWNPQIETIERMEAILQCAIELGFEQNIDKRHAA